MPLYYNLSLYDSSTNIMQLYAVTDTLMKGVFSMFLVVVFGILITAIRLKQNEEPVNAIMLGSFFSFMLSMILYVSSVFYSGIQKPGLYIFVPAIVFIVTVIVKYYDKR